MVVWDGVGPGAELRVCLCHQIAKPPSQARKLKEKYDAERAGGVYLSWRTVGGLAFVGLGASMYIASKIGSPSRKGYEQVFVPKDH